MNNSFTIQEYDLKILTLRAKRFTYKEIGRKLGISEKTVERRLKNLPVIWPKISSFVEHVQKDRTVERLLLREIALENPFFNWMEKRWQEGFHHGPAPFGYRRDVDGDLVVLFEEAKKVKQLFDGYTKGKSLLDLQNETGMRVGKIHAILHNPVYKGFVCLKGQCHDGRHEAIVDRGLWNRCQRHPDRPFSGRSLPWGYKYKKGHVVINSEKDVKKIRQMFQLRVEGKSFSEIGRALKWNPGTVRRRIKNPFYAALEFKSGKLRQMNHDPIIDCELWEEANKIKTSAMKGILEANRREKELNRASILAFLRKNGLSTTSQIQKEVSLNRTSLLKHLKALAKEKLVEMIPPKTKRNKNGTFPAYRWCIK